MDLLRILSLHIAVIHRLLSFIHQLQLQAIYSLYLLYQGQKNNILRQRVDTCEYDQSQLLFGIVLFSILIFFFPSFAAFYYLFAFTQLSVVFIQYLLWSTAIAIKEFPLYSLVMYIVNSKILSDGVVFTIQNVQTMTTIDNNVSSKNNNSNNNSNNSDNNISKGQFFSLSTITASLFNKVNNYNKINSNSSNNNLKDNKFFDDNASIHHSSSSPTTTANQSPKSTLSLTKDNSTQRPNASTSTNIKELPVKSILKR